MMLLSWSVLVLTLTISRVSADSTVLALYETSVLGDAQIIGYQLAAAKWNMTDVDIVYQQINCDSTEQVSVMTLTCAANLVTVGGCCQRSRCQNVYSQFLYFESNRQTEAQSNIVNIRADVFSTFSAFVELCYHEGWRSVLIVSDGTTDRGEKWLLDILTDESMLTSLLSLSVVNDASFNAGIYDVIVTLSGGTACSLDRRSLVILLTGESQPVIDCSRDIIILSPDISTLQTARNDAHNGLADLQAESLYSYDAMSLSLQALSQRIPSQEMMKIFRQTSHDGMMGRIEVDTVTGQRRFDVIINQYSSNGVVKQSGLRDKMGLNLTGDIDNRESMKSAGEDDSVELSILVIMSSLSLIAIAYTVALIAFNCSKSKDRIIKLTSPNINLMTCLGCLLMLCAVPPLGINQSITDNITLIAMLKQGSVFALNVGATVVFASILVKTWRVHRIFKKMNLSNKATKDEHLLLMIIFLALVDVAVNSIWVKVDHLRCRFVDRENVENTVVQVLLCDSEYIFLWGCVLLAYKLLLVMLTLFYAWQVRNVKLPSLRDSRSIFANTWVISALMLTSLPVFLSSNTSYTIRYSTQALAVVLAVLSTISLLLLPKVFLLLKQDKSKQHSAVKFLFSESLQKSKEGKGDGCFSCLRGSQSGSSYGEEAEPGCFSCPRGSQSGSAIGDSVLSQEIEHLKQLVKEKDDSIRDLTDRLFFGADRFKAYVHEKTTPRHSDASIRYQDRSRFDHPSHRHRQRSHSRKSHTSVSNFIQSDDEHFTTISTSSEYMNGTDSRGQHRRLPILQPISEFVNKGMGSEDETIRSPTPTTDSAINMSPSNSSSDREDDFNCNTKHNVQHIMHQVQSIMRRSSENINSPSIGQRSREAQNDPSSVVGEEVTLDIVLPDSMRNCISDV